MRRIFPPIGAIIFSVALLFPSSLFADEKQTANPSATVVIAIGAGGEDEYAAAFSKAAAQWKKGAAAGGAHAMTIGAGADEKECLAQLKKALDTEPKETPAELWLVLLGHGTFDGRDGKFNLRGDDVSASELADWLKPFSRPVIVVCGFSASGTFLKPLSAPNRVIVCATKSGGENNYSRFGGFFAEAIADSGADLDKDGETSVLEAWLSAAKKTADFYNDDRRIATEHSLLDDNGDGLGTPADWFRGGKLAKKPKDAQTPDGLRAAQIHLVPSAPERALSAKARADRDAIELELAKLRSEKASLPETEYFARLEAMLMRLARIYRGAKTAETP